MAAVASLGKLGRVMVMAVDLAFVFVVGILGTKDSWTYGAGKVFNVVFAIQGRDI